MEIIKLPADVIKKDNSFETRKKDLAIIEDVRRRNLIYPLTVWENENREFILLDGYSRIDGVISGQIPCSVMRGNFLDAMCERFRINSYPSARSFYEVSKGVENLIKAGEKEKMIVEKFLPSARLEPSVKLLEELKKISSLPEDLGEILSDKKSPMKIYTLATLLPPDILQESLKIIKKYSLSLSKIKELFEQLFLITERKGVSDTVLFLKGLSEKGEPSCNFSFFLWQEANPELWKRNERLHKLDIQLRGIGPFRIRWDENLEDEEIIFEVKLTPEELERSLKSLQEEAVREILKSAVKIITKE